MKINWLDRRIACPGPYLCLVLSQEEFSAAMRHCRVSTNASWIRSPRAHATTHFLQNDKGELVCVVALSDWQTRNGVEIAGLLVHEAVHVWQEYCQSIGEYDPGSEQEAYAVQAIAQELMAEFARRVQ